MQLPTSLPPLPESPQGPWSSEICDNYSFLNSKYSHAVRILNRTGHDEPTRLLLVAQDLNSKSELLEFFDTQGLPSAWIEAVALCCAVLMQRLMQFVQLGRGQCVRLDIISNGRA